MTTTTPFTRRSAQALARVGVVVSAAMLAVTGLGFLPSGTPAAGAAEAAGFAEIVTPQTGPVGSTVLLPNGGSATAFSLRLPPGAACTKDTASGGYTVSSFFVKDGTDVGALQFEPLTGPSPTGTGADIRQPLYTADTGEFYTSQSTANATDVGGPGPVINIPAFNFELSGIAAGGIPAGTYLLGIACLKRGAASADQVDRFWTAKMTVTTDGAEPAPGIKWASITQTGGGSTTTSTTTGSGGSSTTSTTKVGGSTTTTKAGGSTTTSVAGGSTTTSTSSAGGSTTTTRASGTTGGGVSGGGGGLAQTGSSPWGLAFWAAVLLICGRLALVLSRPPKVPQRG